MSDNKRNAELLSSQTNAGNESSNNSTSGKKNHQLREREQVGDTPFQIVGSEEDGYFLAIGRLRITEGGETKEELLRKLEVRDWELIINMILGFAEVVRVHFNDLDEVLPVTQGEPLTKEQREWQEKYHNFKEEY